MEIVQEAVDLRIRFPFECPCHIFSEDVESFWFLDISDVVIAEQDVVQTGKQGIVSICQNIIHHQVQLSIHTLEVSPEETRVNLTETEGYACGLLWCASIQHYYGITAVNFRRYVLST